MSAPARPPLFRKIPVSVFIITLNEAKNIGACLDRLAEFDEVILVDSGSTDGTVGIAERHDNVKSSFNEWPGFGRQKAHALSLCSNEWVLNLDADEIPTDEYIEEVRRVVEADEADALESARVLYRWGARPKDFGRDDRLVRLFRKSRGHYPPRGVHESVSVSGRVVRTNAAIEHHENLGYSRRVDKANRYSLARARDKFERGDRAGAMTLLLIFPVTFARLYLFKGHFRDGVDGLLTSMNAAFYAFMKYAKLWEMRRGRDPEA